MKVDMHTKTYIRPRSILKNPKTSSLHSIYEDIFNPRSTRSLKSVISPTEIWV